MIPYLSVIEFNDALSTLVVLSVDGSLINGPPLDTDGTICAILSYDADVRVTTALLHEDATLLELNGPRLCRVRALSFLFQSSRVVKTNVSSSLTKITATPQQV